MTDVEVRVAHDVSEVESALALRERVFCGEQGVSINAERDGRDREAAHLVALAEGQVIATCRLLVTQGTVRLSRMAVEPSMRRRGVGRGVLVGAEEWARAAGAHRITLHAQMPVKSLYEGAGYAARGRPFVEEGIEHVLMEKSVA